MSTLRSLFVLAVTSLIFASVMVSQTDANGDLDSLLQELSFNEPQAVAVDREFDLAPLSEQDGFSYLEPSQLPEPLWERNLPSRSDAGSQQLIHGPSIAEPSPMPPAWQGGPQNNRPQYCAPQPLCRTAMPQRRGCHCGGAAACNCFAQAPVQTEYMCIPHRAPNLPSSSLYQYFHSDACYTGLWDGYAQEKARHCANHHKHIHGTCDCAQKSLEHHQNGGLFCKPPIRAGCHNGCDTRRY